MISTNVKASRAGFTLTEIMIVVAVIALLAAIAVPAFLRARKRSQASLIKNELRMIDSAVAQYAVETNKRTGDAVEVDDWIDYVKEDSNLYDDVNLLGDEYGDQVVDSLPAVPGASWDALSDVVDSDFWAPYPREGPTPIPRHRAKRRRHH